MQVKFSLTKEDITKLVVETFKNKNPTVQIDTNNLDIYVIDENNKYQSFKSIEIIIKE